MYMRAWTLSRALQTPSSCSKKASSNSSSVSGPTLVAWAMMLRAGFISRALRAAASDLSCWMSDARKRNWRLRLDFSMVSMSVTYTAPAGPQARPMRAQFLRVSQPMAPAPTSMYRRDSRRRCSVRPKTAICPSYREPSGSNSSWGRSAGGRASSASNMNHCRTGMNLPVHAFIASCAAMLPMTAAMGASEPRAQRASRRTSPSSTFSTRALLITTPSAATTSRLNWCASSTTASASSAQPGRGVPSSCTQKESTAWNATSSCRSRSIFAKSLVVNSGSRSEARRDLKATVRGCFTCRAYPPEV
mmetsp:Transcript_17692/g.37330  ORF Transcript_17692/g.37330 Transcript_17692/m.37330 type:complete len:304 (-) Transcript_17692:1159-2070(-)